MVNTHTHLESLVLQVHFEQRVSDQVSETTAVEITVWPCVTSVIVDLRELKATKLMEVISMEILVLAEHLLTKKGSTVCCQQNFYSPHTVHWTLASDAHVKRKNSGCCFLI